MELNNSQTKLMSLQSIRLNFVRNTMKNFIALMAYGASLFIALRNYQNWNQISWRIQNQQQYLSINNFQKFWLITYTQQLKLTFIWESIMANRVPFATSTPLKLKDYHAFSKSHLRLLPLRSMNHAKSRTLVTFHSIIINK